MSKRQKPSDRRRAELVREARAGLLPQSDDLVNEVRARMNRTALSARSIKTYTKLATCSSEELAISTILADLRHYCASKELSFRKLNADGYTLYVEEVSESRLVTTEQLEYLNVPF
jgi:hypothetical protein